MRKLFTFMALCLVVLITSAQEGVTYNLRTLTFEDSNGSTYWTNKIDSPQYNGPLLYGGSSIYQWCDSANTLLRSAIPYNYGANMYWGGGHAISNYWDGNLFDGDYMHQLAVYVPDNNASGQGGHGYNGSNNFCVHYGYIDGTQWNLTENLPYFEFCDNQARTIHDMYVNINTYLANTIINGNSLTSKLGDDDYIAVTATGYKADGSTSTSTFYLADGPDFVVTDWSQWVLTSLGNVNKIEFNVIGSNDNGYGFSQPAYFCYDNVSVQFPITGSISSKVRKQADETTNSDKTLTVTLDGASKNWLSGDVPGDCSYDFTSDYDVPSYLTTGQTNNLTIKGLPGNSTITGIDVTGYCEQRKGAATIKAYMDNTEISSLEYGGTKANHGKVVGQTKTKMKMDLLTDVSTACTGDLILKATCEAQNMTVVTYDIHYKIEDDLTGISNATANDNGKINEMFDQSGRKIKTLQKGINIIRMENGKTRKVVVK